MASKDVKGYPQYPKPPPGTARRDHLPTVEASVLYWEAIRDSAIAGRDDRLARTADGLRMSYMAIRRDLLSTTKTAGESRPKKR